MEILEGMLQKEKDNFGRLRNKRRYYPHANVLFV